jgi:hypothetical protein
VVLSDDGATLDVAATQALRAVMPAPSGMFHRREYFDDVEPAPPAP